MSTLYIFIHKHFQKFTFGNLYQSSVKQWEVYSKTFKKVIYGIVFSFLVVTSNTW